MYIEFRLPDVDDKHKFSYAAHVAITCIDKDIAAWAEKHNIRNFKTKRNKLTYRLVLANEHDYTHFALTWEPRFHASARYEFRQPK